MQLSADETELLELLEANARLSTSQLARQLGVARSTVQSRMERLESRGIIGGYTVRRGEEWDRQFVRAHVMVSSRPDATRAVEASVAELSDVTSLWAISGSFDMIVVVEARGTEELNAALNEIRSIAGIDRTETSVILSNRFRR